jgi:malate dehydrogenase (oxaloacetate-decarboxylating)
MSSHEEASLRLHEEHRGKIEVRSKVPLDGRDDLSAAYTPGVAEPCRRIAADPELAYRYTIKSNTVAIVSDGSAVLGLGDIGPLAALPVMEGKALLFKSFADIDAFPLCLDTQNADEIVETVVRLAPVFGGINLEDIRAPRCFEVERRLRRELDIPVFHDDQHGTAIVLLAALENASRVTGKDLRDLRVVVVGSGAAGIATAKLLLGRGMEIDYEPLVADVILCDRKGIVYPRRPGIGVNEDKVAVAEMTNAAGLKGSLADAMADADVFIGLAAPGLVTPDMVRSMAEDPVVFALSNPVPEIGYYEALEAGAAVAGTGRSDFPNQINNVLAFPGVLRGALDARVGDIDSRMKLAAARAIASCVADPSPDLVIPNPFDPRVPTAVAEAVRQGASENARPCLSG